MSAVMVPGPVRGEVAVVRGAALLAAAGEEPGLGAHRQRHGELPALGVDDLADLCDSAGLCGRGGAAFPFARKLTTARRAGGRAVVVVNLSEGEPGSLKDAVLAQVAPHLVLDGAVATARALKGREIHVVVAGEAPRVRAAVRHAMAERRDPRIRWSVHEAGPWFVAGQATAVLELLAGRPNLPVTRRTPAAESGHRGRPTLLSNAETFAHVGWLALRGPAAYRRLGTADEPGTTLLTLDGDRSNRGRVPRVVEVPMGAPWSGVLDPERLRRPLLLGGYHGTWAAPDSLRAARVSRTTLPAGLTLGAGVVLPLDRGCPLDRTAEITAYLAGQSARRCGPCHRGLPALAAALDAVRRGAGGHAEAGRLAGLVAGRGACAHPSGTARLVGSLLQVFGDEPAEHVSGRCGFDARSLRSRRRGGPA